MLRLFAIALVSLMTFSMPSFAETKEFSEEQIEQFTQQLGETKKRLNLSKEQEEAVKPILKESAEKRRAIFKTYGFEQSKDKPELSFSKKRSLYKENKAIKQKTNEKLSKILSKEQMKEYQKIQEEQRENLKEKRNKQ